MLNSTVSGDGRGAKIILLLENNCCEMENESDLSFVYFGYFGAKPNSFYHPAFT